jgi:hypothetical protein
MLSSIGRGAVRVALTVAILTGFHTVASAKDLMVFDMRKALQMTNSEVVYRDYYINGGRKDGLRPGMIVTVSRRVATFDTYSNSSPGDLDIVVGKIKIIHVEDGVSVARLVSVLSRDRLPLVEIEAVLVGDRLRMDSVEMDRGPRKDAAAESPAVDKSPAGPASPAATEARKDSAALDVTPPSSAAQGTPI